MPVFGEQQAKGKPSAVPIVNEIVGRVNDNTKRLRLLEQREKIITERVSSIDDTMMTKLSSVEESMKALQTKIAALEGREETVSNTLKEVVKQMQFLAKKSELKKTEETLKILESMLSGLAENGNASG
jgi:prephenate dehydratase